MLHVTVSNTLLSVSHLVSEPDPLKNKLLPYQRVLLFESTDWWLRLCFSTERPAAGWWQKESVIFEG